MPVSASRKHCSSTKNMSARTHRGASYVKDGKLGNYLGNSSTTYTKSSRQMPGVHSTRDMEARTQNISKEREMVIFGQRFL